MTALLCPLRFLLLLGVLLGIPAHAQTPLWRDVTWIEPVNVSTTAAVPPASGAAAGTAVRKTLAGVAWNAGARSLQEISGDGAVEFRFDQKNMFAMVGLAGLNRDANYTGLDYAIYGTATGLIEIYELGTKRGANYGAYSTGDVFRIERRGSQVTYFKGGTVLYTSTVPALGRLLVDTSLYTSGAGVSGVRLWA